MWNCVPDYCSAYRPSRTGLSFFEFVEFSFRLDFERLFSSFGPPISTLFFNLLSFVFSAISDSVFSLLDTAKMWIIKNGVWLPSLRSMRKTCPSCVQPRLIQFSTEFSCGKYCNMVSSTKMFVSVFSMWTVIVCVAGQMRPSLSARIVKTKQGSVKGVVVIPSNRELQPVEAFLGLPYASPPVGPLRFMPPVSPLSWNGVRLMDKYAPACPQTLPDVSNEREALRFVTRGRLQYLRRLLPYLRNQSEDCLYLNIYAPVTGRPGKCFDAVTGDLFVFVSSSFRLLFLLRKAVYISCWVQI